MWVVQVQKDLVDLSKHYIHEIDVLVSLHRAECFAVEKKNIQKQLHSSSKIVSLRSRHFCGIQISLCTDTPFSKKIGEGTSVLRCG